MRTQSICVALAIVLLCPYASAQWVQTNGPGGGYIQSFAVSGTNLFAGMSGGVFRSTNTGTSWTSANTGLTDNDVRHLVVSDTNLIAAPWGGGVCLSTNNGTSWRAVNTGLPPGIALNTLAVSGTHLIAGTWGDGLWRRPLSEMFSVELVSSELPTDFSLSQNYPNPFNPSTTITFELPKSSVVTLSLFDLPRREVSVLVNERREAGVHEVIFDASGLSS